MAMNKEELLWKIIHSMLVNKHNTPLIGRMVKTAHSTCQLTNYCVLIFIVSNFQIS